MSYLDQAMEVLGKCLHSYTGQQAQEVARRMRHLVEEEREACALLHEHVNVDPDREPMAVAIEYRDRIRARAR